MQEKIRDEIYLRLVFAKYLHKEAEIACSNEKDQMSFAKGILFLHDSVESCLGALADYLHAEIPPNTYLLQYYDYIREADSENRVVPYRSQMRKLNTLRNNVKHIGIFPDIKSNAHFPSTISSFLTDVYSKYFNLDLTKISLKSLIKDKDIRKYIDEAEKYSESEDFENALVKLAFAMYHICELVTIPFLFWTSHPDMKNQKYFPPRTESIEFTVRLIEHGIDPSSYHDFKYIAPTIVVEKGSEERHIYWNPYVGHSGNWTIENVRFCLYFCIDTAIKFQKRTKIRNLIHYNEMFIDELESKGKEVLIWNRSKYDYLTQDFRNKDRFLLLKLEKGKKILGRAYKMPNRLDEWIIESKSIDSKHKGLDGRGIGYADVEELIVTSKPIGEAKDMKDEE